ncbi:YlcI/YnfO family protein [Actinoplanes sp. RD1]|uniref:YlcI/YnfO family protein n=1 Tax=Actinoplanes sp. RD1 TaxID=3064538 RepID=UPI0027404090|nr:YlcI/YnfO family protein [Actinoplanes sp. RD1]
MSITDARIDTEPEEDTPQHGAGVGNKRITVTLPEGLVAALKEEALELDVSVSQFVKAAVRRELEIQETKREWGRDLELDPDLKAALAAARDEDQADDIEERFRR